MSVDPLRDQLAANCDAPRDSVEWERADEAYRDYVEAKARRDLAGPQPPAEDIRNALQILAHPKWMSTEDVVTIERLLRHALTQLESPK